MRRARAVMVGIAALGLVSAAEPARPVPVDPTQALPPRVRRIVLHALGHPGYHRPELRFTFFDPPQTMALWKRNFGAHWIVWTDGSVWPRRQGSGARSWRPERFEGASAAERRRLAWEAAPVYSHLHNGNSRTVGMELAHSGRSGEAFPAEQLRSAAFLVRTLLEMSGGRLGASSVLGHKDLDRRPAYVHSRCARPGCAVFVDDDGRPYRRRVDPPEALFEGLARQGVHIPRRAGGDADLVRAEALPPGRRPAEARLPAHAPRGPRAGRPVAP
jgi:hypothetical protein